MGNETQVKVLKQLVDYQEGTVVSRTLSDKKTGTVTLFAFSEGQGLSEHKAPFDALVQILEDVDLARAFQAATVAGDLHEAHVKIEFHGAHEIGNEGEHAIEQPYDHEIFPGIILRQLSPQFPDPGTDLGLGQEGGDAVPHGFS